jgi:hypothetical protein
MTTSSAPFVLSSNHFGPLLVSRDVEKRVVPPPVGTLPLVRRASKDGEECTVCLALKTNYHGTCSACGATGLHTKTKEGTDSEDIGEDSDADGVWTRVERKKGSSPKNKGGLRHASSASTLVTTYTNFDMRTYPARRSHFGSKRRDTRAKMGRWLHERYTASSSGMFGALGEATD